MQINIGPIRVNVFQPSGWVYDTDEGMAGSVGLFGMVSGGVGGGRLTVRQSRPNLPNTGSRYRMPFAQVQVGIGTPWPIPVSVGGGIEDYPSGSFGPIFRMPGSPDSSGEGGPPTGFLGTFNMVSVEGVAVAGGLSLTALLMGANTLLGMEIPNSFKYFTLFWGVPIASVVGASATGIRGTFLDVTERTD
ncbi:MAG: hypothetical protein AB1Z98_28560 [Nannocystaceae bacterium]